MINAAIKRTTESGIEAVLGSFKPQEVETALEVKAEGGYDYTPLLAKLKEYLNLLARKEIYSADTVLETLDTTLLPEQINTFLQTTATLEKHPQYIAKTGEFISRLIQKSYTAGNNNFTLNLESLPAPHQIGCKIKGTTHNPVNITITGKAGDYCGWFAERETFNAEETGDYSGFQAKNCTFNTQKTGTHCGANARCCTFNVEETGKFCGYGAENCTFKTTNPKTLQQMLAEVSKGNRVVFINANGKEEVKRDYNE